ncbi:DUF4304 domain-containing protein [Capnocytophaga cynodegmi]|uniref:DUF4304 domain-containing protein n=1 Tax=Capnocytophaga cynodegmi TaxID=28189 RepID=A0A0B7HLT2_9FLAO|nr:DUF4304 domain-containing protein [Capnocytophaga cynodegmi]CEN38842.1 conserved hypothetical protein [Capnocytophaga cynodegmi]
MKEKTNAQLAFDKTMKAIYDLLKPIEFRKKGNSFYRIENTICQLINIQKSIYNNSQSVTFTANICVKHLETDENIPSVTHFPIRERIGNLKESGDFWYTFDEIQDIFIRKQKYQSEKELILKDIEKYALPFLNKFKNKEDIENFYE